MPTSRRSTRAEVSPPKPKAATDPTTVQTLIFSKEKFKSADAAKKWATDHDFKGGAVDETEDSYRIRQRDPGDFKPKSFRTIELEDGVSAVIGKLKSDGASAQHEAYRPSGLLALRAAAWGHEFEILLGGGALEPPPPFHVEGAAALVDVQGPLVHHLHCFWDSYDAIAARVDAAFDCPEAKCVLMRINSPGGDVDGCFEFVRELRAMAVRHEKPLLAFVDGMAASAAYAIACAADSITVPPTGFVGSIGIIEALVDQSGLDEKMGLRFRMVASGKHKADGNPHVPITDDAESELQSHVDGLAELFYDLVTEMRGIPQAKSRGLEARMFFGERAVEAGLADAVDTLPSLIAKAATATRKEKVMPKYLDEAMKMLKSAAEEGDDKNKKVANAAMKAALKALEEGDGGEGAPPEKKEGKAEGEGEGEEEEKRKAKAKAEEEEKKMRAAEEEKKAAARRASAGAQASAAPDVVDMAKQLHELKAERAAEKEQAERDALFAKRPDFTAEVKRTLASASLEILREAVEKWPKIVGTHAPAAAAGIMGTRGRTQNGEGHDVVGNADDQAFIDGKMGFGTAGSGISSVGNHLALGPMSPEQAKKKLEELEKKGAV